MLTFFYPDSNYPQSEITHVRPISRAIVLNQDGKVYLHHIHRDDIFGNQEYYETPGGGVDEGESYEEGLIRECEEELGAIIEILAPICHVRDFYMLIGRQNEQNFYLAKEVGKTKAHFESSGDTMITETKAYPIDEAIALMESQSDEGVAGLVKQRELPILYLAKAKIKEILQRED